MLQHVLPVRVYYDDTDASGVVYHSNYLKFFERGRTEALRDLGFNVVDLYNEYGLQFAVHSANVEFLQPARLNQLLSVVTSVETIRHASIIYQQSIHLETPKGPLLCRGKLRLATLNKAYKPCALPQFLILAMTGKTETPMDIQKTMEKSQ